MGQSRPCPKMVAPSVHKIFGTTCTPKRFDLEGRNGKVKYEGHERVLRDNHAPIPSCARPSVPNILGPSIYAQTGWPKATKFGMVAYVA